jgi:hypothetical protein
MKSLCAARVLTLTLVLTGCADSVPSVEDPHNIVIDGLQMTQQAFLLQYCSGKKDNETCLRVSQAMAQDSFKSKDGPARF